MNQNLLIVGAGQYGVLVCELAQSLGTFAKIDFLDDDKEIAMGKTEEYKSFSEEYSYAVPAFGNSELRVEWTEKLEKSGFCVPVLISPMAYVSTSATIGKGTIVEPMAVVNTNVEVGNACIISANSTVNHNSVIGDGCHIDCGAVVMSNSNLKSGAKINCGEVYREE